eukprot:TRINITY_DN12522_c0_g2_i1.p1 TRINITY_DN12522_c0_g2~~TRINITY_DN12522_c0_g2_i1.p1  ORF type:complete len:326 (+),score=74.45 TRINITY_DN12522_c0_g2_i1:93-1070(+)
MCIRDRSYSVSTDTKSPSLSQKGYGNGFVSEDSREIMHNLSFDCPGPGVYDPEKPRAKSLAGRVFAYTGRQIADGDDILRLNIPFDENNPLNYIKPISLNVYVKPTIPGPGEYDTYSTLKGNGCQAAFKSGMGRTLKFSAGKKDVPGVGQYSMKSEFESVGSRKVVKSEKKSAVGYEWLGDGAELVNKNYAKEIYMNSDANIVNYAKLHSIQKLKDGKQRINAYLEEESMMEEQNLSAAFAISDVDRFGEQLRPKRPIEVKPGPGGYDVNLQPVTKNQGAPKIMPSTFKGAPRKLQVQPGPAFYNPLKEPVKSSYHMNVNGKWMY